MKELNEEIERKFLMKSFPDGVLNLLDASCIYQSYLSTDPEVRVRRRIYRNGTLNFRQTIKGNGTLKRVEVEIDLTENQYLGIMTLIDKTPIRKIYKSYRLDNGLVLEVSKVDNTFYYGEVEFESVEQAESWKPNDLLSEFILKEVTDDSRYKMKNYWITSRELRKD
jgi:CYTH domain-containing protein